MLIDTHCHLYLENFNEDSSTVINRAISSGVQKILLPNIDKDTILPMHNLCKTNPEFFAMALGLHPTSVKEDYKQQLDEIFNYTINIHAIGETGIDLYWDKTFFKQQQYVFDFQLNYACENNFPIIIHSRNSFNEVLEIVSRYVGKGITGVFHCFPGDYAEACKAVDMGFYLGIGGVVTYKNSNLVDVVTRIPLKHLILETDSPFLSPVPHRGKRNEPAFIKDIAVKVSELKNISFNDVATETTNNAKALFNFD